MSVRELVVCEAVLPHPTSKRDIISKDDNSLKCFFIIALPMNIFLNIVYQFFSLLSI